MPELSKSTKELVKNYEIWQLSRKPKEGAITLHVDEVASRVAAFYEQIRIIIDWKEEHLMRRAAIIRKLKRRFLDLELSEFSAQNISEPLVLELIRGGYFPNDKIEETKVSDISKIIGKYVFILRNNTQYKKGKSGVSFYTKTLEIAACEIEETLAPSLKEMALIDFMFSQMRDKIVVNEKIYNIGLLKKEDADIQIYIAVQKALFKLDEPIISYNLLRYKYSFWDNPLEEELLKITQNFHKILYDIKKDLSLPTSRKFYTICEKYDTPYLLLGDILVNNGVEAVEKISEPTLLEESIRKVYFERRATLKKRIFRAAFYATLSILLTNSVSVFIIEVPLTKLLTGNLTPLAIFVDIFAPTLIMFLLVSTIKMPSNKNLTLVIIETMKIVYVKEKPDIYEVKIAKKRHFVTRFILSLIYLAGAVVSFGIIYFILNYFAFPLTSIIINTVFLTLIFFTSIAIRTRSRELSIEEESGEFLGFITDIFFLPVAEAGRWFSNKWKRYNAITVFFNALIDMPFSSFVEFIERWRYFLKEKKEDMQ